MIHVYTGKTGSGKSFNMVKDVFPFWYSGVDIYSNTKLLFENFGGTAGSNIKDNPENFTINEKIIEWLRKQYCKIKKIEYIPKRRGGIQYFEDITEVLEAHDAIILIDEGQALLDSRNWESLPMEFSNKLRQHRKHYLDLYITTQNMGTVDINLRRLVQRWIHCKDRFALFGIRNPSLFSVHTAELKDIDELYNSVDDLVVSSLKTSIFIIHKFKKRFYDTLYDIGFTTLQSIWIEKNNQRIGLIIPKKMTMSSVRSSSTMMKFFLDQTKLMSSGNQSKMSKKSY